MDQYIQVGSTALRAPDGSFLPSVPLYVKATPENVAAESALTLDFAAVMARKMRAYIQAGGQVGRRKGRKPKPEPPRPTILDETW